MKKKIFIGLFSSLVLIGCSEDYLEAKPNEFVTPEQVGEVSEYDPSILNGFLSGVYSTMYTDGVGGTDGDDDFGQKGIDIYTDMLSGDMALSRSAYGWYRNLTRLTATEDFTRTENYVPWRYYYRIIFGANNVIKAQGGNDAQPTTDGGRYALGQAKALRAYGHFYLQQLYANEYIPSDKSIPLKLSSDNNSQPRATSLEVMTQVVKDLEEAIVLLDGFSRPNKTSIDADVAKGLAAYAYAYIGDAASLAKARDYAKDVADNSGYSILSRTEAVGGFNSVDSNSWMWGVDLTTDMGFNLVSWWGQVDLFTYSYQWAGDRKAIDNGLFALINNNDVRKTQFNTSVATTNSRYLLPSNKFYHPGRAEGGQRYIETDIVFMRVEEMYLLYAECAAKTGMELEAKDYLKLVLANRFSNAADYAYIDSLTGQPLLNEIYLQTRVEFWGEGKSYLAMKRNKATISRGSNHLSFQGVPMPYNDPRLTFEIPQAEVLNNPNL
ncbi:RagB/SusD family nutrient uptake outer membrane protein [Flavobacterium luminosum]|uniref:RagB/SusD family nutrient uptake outer membrane protein n=1 Tax=Flavobacterium luminosum TaxID=2949086 RepID=A0ABT0TKR7_9FLAO|nr:RagB/SusD family nutrient uptake outer membrane protein [Flavobacterium sp. HXWNR70]MCL9807901.1 RagB/SusD family nutrient uptake outer membrane protein [Flavobacterium sp. HXWNR70]